MMSCGWIGLKLTAKGKALAALFGAIAILVVSAIALAFPREGPAAASDWIVIPHENDANAPVVLTEVLVKVVPSDTGKRTVDKKGGPVFSIRNKERSRIVRSVDFALEVRDPVCRILFQAVLPLGPMARIKVNTNWNEAVLVRGPVGQSSAPAGDSIPDLVADGQSRVVAKIAHIYWEGGGIWTAEGYPVPTPSQPRPPSTPNPPVPPVAPSMIAPPASPNSGK